MRRERSGAGRIRTVDRRGADVEGVRAGCADGVDAFRRIDAPRDHDRAETEKPTPAGGDEVERFGFGRAIGENVDAGAALCGEGAALRLDLRGGPAELRRMAARRAGERQIAAGNCAECGEN